MRTLYSPVAIFLYNRHDTLERVLEVLSKFSPPKVFLICDGPKPTQPEDFKLVNQARALAKSILANQNIEWKIAAENLGVRKSFSQGFEFIFSKADRCIILEDDTLPSYDFFNFCDELLVKYWNYEKIASISGTNLTLGNPDTDVHFSRYPQVWGWATWRHKWTSNYDPSISGWRNIRNNKELLGWLGNSENIRYWSRKFDDIINGKIDTWDTQVAFMFFINNFLTAIPSVNLVSNIGFNRKDATHTLESSSIANLPRYTLPKPITFPQLEIPNEDVDRKLSFRYSAPSLKTRILRKALMLATNRGL